MNFNDYQAAAISTAVYPSEYGLWYTTLGLVGEAGEVAEKMKKFIRDDHAEMTDERRAALIDELGDVLWYIANLSDELNVDLAYIAEQNVKKLSDRRDRDVLNGDGDDR